jgi:hypothetical protein
MRADPGIPVPEVLNMKLALIPAATVALIALLASAAEAGRVVTAPSGNKVTITETCMTTCTETVETRNGALVKIRTCTTVCDQY